MRREMVTVTLLLTPDDLGWSDRGAFLLVSFHDHPTVGFGGCSSFWM